MHGGIEIMHCTILLDGKHSINVFVKLGLAEPKPGINEFKQFGTTKLLDELEPISKFGWVRTIYLCMYVCLYACVCVCMYVCTYVSMYACVYVCMHVR